MTIDQLRATWREVLASEPPSAFPKDLLARAIAFHVQQKRWVVCPQRPLAYSDR
jgi:hypothetical protein